MWTFGDTAAHTSVTVLQGQNVFRLVTPAGTQYVGDLMAFKGLLMADSL